ncbi:MAG: hypothetical protein ACFB2Y_16050 [Fulvivirga sp.]
MKTCPSCGEQITGRLDKKFCTPYSKSAYHYLKNRDRPQSQFKKIDKQLKLNRRILKEYNKAGKATVRKSVLLREAFNPKYFTHYWKNNKGDVYSYFIIFAFLHLNP